MPANAAEKRSENGVPFSAGRKRKRARRRPTENELRDARVMWGTMHAAEVAARLQDLVERLDQGVDASAIRRDLRHCITQAELWVTYGRAAFDERYARQLLEAEA